jgi:hypothetical protein
MMSSLDDGAGEVDASVDARGNPPAESSGREFFNENDGDGESDHVGVVALSASDDEGDENDVSRGTGKSDVTGRTFVGNPKP